MKKIIKTMSDMNKEDLFAVSYDAGEVSTEEACLLVARNVTNKGIFIINEFHGAEARELYKKLTEPQHPNKKVREKRRKERAAEENVEVN